MKVYLNKYPTIKDAPGPWQTTFIYSAARQNHLEIVKYLIEHGADYYLRNQAFETSLDNIERKQSITRYFEGILNRGFIEEDKNLPEEPIREIKFENGRKDCV